jgi:hypothetical protein
MIAIGAMLKRSKILALKDAVAALGEMFGGKKELFLLNKKALEKGFGR